MRKIITLALVSILATSCSSVKDYATFSGIVKGNPKTITLKNKKAHIDKTIKVSSNGVFKDTLKLEKPTYLAISDGEHKSVVYFKNGDDIRALLSTKDFDNMTFTGKGAEESAYMAKKNSMQKKFFGDSLFYKPESEFKNKLAAYTQVFEDELAKAKDSAFKKKQAKYIKSFAKNAKSRYKFKSYLVKNLGKGTPAPDFTYAYKDESGKEYTLKDLKGKNLYIKFWATWCGYCKKEAPYYKKLAKKYKGKNIEFVSISIDNPRSEKLWKKTVEKDDFDGIELFSKDDKEFKKKYKITQIPRFMLIDSQGKIIETELPDPSKGTMPEILDKL